MGVLAAPLDLGRLGLFHPLLELWSFKQTLVGEVSNETSNTRPLHGLCDKLVQQYKKFVDRADREGLENAIKATFRSVTAMFELVLSTVYSEMHTPPGWPTKQRADESFSIRPLHAYAARTVQFDNHVAHSYGKLLLIPATDVTNHARYDDAQTVASKVFGWSDMPHHAYWNWVAYFYERELLAVFGTASFVASELLPVQLIDQIKTEGIYWS